jgi:hypothetical protein
MKKQSEFRLRAIGLTASLVFTACAAQEVKPVNPAVSCERDELGVCMLPPLPPPTVEQFKKGRELLDKIVYVIENVPLSDEVAVMKVFGFTDLYAWESPGNTKYSPYRDVGPKGKHGGFTLPDELVGTGLTFVRVQPWIRSPNNKESANLHGSFSTVEVCVSIDDVRTMFKAKSKISQSYSVTDIHPTARPPRLHQTGHLQFTDVTAFRATQASALFTFEYQQCAKSFGISYRNN